MSDEIAQDRSTVNSAQVGLRRILGNDHLAERFTAEQQQTMKDMLWTLGTMAREIDYRATEQGEPVEYSDT